MNPMQYGLLYVFGDPNTCKTTMIKQWKEEKISLAEYRPTKGISTTYNKMIIKDEEYNVKIKETNGQDERDGDRVVLIGDRKHRLKENNNIPVFIYILFDVTRRETFQSIDNFWIPFIQDHQLTAVSTTIIGTKS